MYKTLCNHFISNNEDWCNNTKLEKAFIKYTNSNTQTYIEVKSKQIQKDHGEYIDYYYRYKGNWFKETTHYLEEGISKTLIAFLGSANKESEDKYKAEMESRVKLYKAKAAYAERMLREIS